jgi:hypothetical protein
MKRRRTKEEFIERAKKVHGEKYDYTKVEYVLAKEKVCITCPIHGDFWQVPACHLQGNGCPECGKIKNHNALRKTTEQFISESVKKWGGKYDYTKAKYKSAHEKVCIICPKHGEFWQEPDNHLRWGCKRCRESTLEEKIRGFLKEKNIIYEEQKTFPWLKHKGFLKLDFFLPSYNIAIECQGEQHFERYRFEKDDERLKRRATRDALKKKQCEEHNIKLLYYGDLRKYDTFLDEPINKTVEEVYKKIIEYGNKNTRRSE